MSPASRGGLKAGDFIVSCDGAPMDDWIDFSRSALQASHLHLETRRGTVRRNVTLGRRPGAGWGLRLEGSDPRPCGRRCTFCFMDQMPRGMRPALYFKDDDIRHSFLHGTYVTLTAEQVSFAVERRLSPVHVSVHSTDPVLRGSMMGAGGPAPVLPQLEELGRAGVEVEAQIVLVPGWNEGERLSNALEDLYAVGCVKSVGVVPVGLTRHRSGLPQLRRPSALEAADCLARCSGFSERALRERGSPWVWPADEMFLLADAPLPPSSWYEGCTLTANGIGLLSSLLDLEERRHVIPRGTGLSAFRHVLQERRHARRSVARGYLCTLRTGDGRCRLPVGASMIGNGR